jgi:ribonuclease J
MLDVIKYYIHKNGRKVDYLITEGTMMGDRKNEIVKNEPDLYREALELFKEHRYVFLIISSTNLDSLVSFYRAAVENRMNMFCYNYYLYNQIKTFSEAAGEYSPWYKFDDVYTVDFEKELSNKYWDKSKTQEEFMREYGFLCVIKADEKYNEWIDKFEEKNPLVIYSMWDGYINLEKGKEAYNEEWAKFFEPYINSGQYRDMHTSGHATAKMITDVIKAVDPQKCIYPMHTENAKGFRELDMDEKYKDMITIGG